MPKPKIGLMTFGDFRPDMWESYFGERVTPLHAEARTFFRSLPIELHDFDEVARSRELTDSQVSALRAAGIEAIVIHTPAWTAANEIVRAVQLLDVPVLLVGNKKMETMGTVAFLAVGGAFSQVGIPHLRILDNFDGDDALDLRSRALPFFKAASVRARLWGASFGLFGGRALGMDTGTIDPIQWKQMFGIDVEQFDQLEIIRRAPLIARERVDNMIAWLENNTAGIEYDDAGLTRAKLEFQVRCYLATKDIVEEAHLDFIAVKCMPDLATHYVPQCISAAFFPGPYDAEGLKKPLMMACESDADGALTMQMLHEISGGGSVLFMDVGYIDYPTNTFYMGNCGAMSTWFARRSDDPQENLREVHLRPSVRPGGGAVTNFTSAPGPMTLARLYRKKGKYYMGIIPGEAIVLSKEQGAAFRAARGKHQLPMAYVKVSVDPDTFIAEFGSNHINAVAGSYADELVHLCHLLDIEPVLMR